MLTNLQEAQSCIDVDTVVSVVRLLDADAHHVEDTLDRFASVIECNMICKYPFMTKNSPNPVKCGKCLSCRINQRSEKTHRIMLEAMAHEENCFVTLTYNDEHLPTMGNVSKTELDLWLKRFRKAYKKPIRVFGVGEYGEESYRPHYHLILFGVPANEETAKILTKTWSDPETGKSRGHVHLGTCTEDSIQYCAGYIVKKLTGRDDWILSQLAPEFTTQSRMPGLGFKTLQNLASVLNERIEDIIDTYGDVPHFLQYGKKKDLWIDTVNTI